MAWDDLVGESALLMFDKKEQDLNGPARRGAGHNRDAHSGGRGIAAPAGDYPWDSRGVAQLRGDVRRRGAAGGQTHFCRRATAAHARSRPVLTGEAMAGSGRLFIDYRLDAEIDHWLLDEFQDTSVGHWSVLRNLVDEAVQDPSGERSFFASVT